MPEQEIKWFIGGQEEPAKTLSKLPYVPQWKTFSKAAEEEKEKLFNDMRASLITLGRMENK